MELASSQSSLPNEGLLIRELTHRINNEFASLMSMVSLAAARTASVEAKYTLSAVLERLESHVRVHSALQMPPGRHTVDGSAYLRELCGSISRSKLASRNINCIFVEHPLSLGRQQCWLVGMIIHELMNNAARHAFDKAGGEIRVEVRRTGNLVECEVSDNGTASPLGPRGRGLKIIEDLAASLAACFKQRYGPHGSTSRIVFPA